MIHFLYLVAFALFVSIIFSVFMDGDLNARIKYGVKTFIQFVGISLIIAWVLYFIPS